MRRDIDKTIPENGRLLRFLFRGWDFVVMLVPGSEAERKYGVLLKAVQCRSGGTCSNSMPELVTLLTSGMLAGKV